MLYFKLCSELQKLDLCKCIVAASARSVLCIHVLAIILYLPLHRDFTLRYLPPGHEMSVLV